MKAKYIRYAVVRPGQSLNDGSTPQYFSERQAGDAQIAAHRIGGTAYDLWSDGLSARALPQLDRPIAELVDAGVL